MNSTRLEIRTLESPSEMAEVEEIQRLVWPNDETEIIPVHMLRAAVHNGGIVVGAYDGDLLVGFVFGFPGVEINPRGPKLYHASHMAGVHPDYRDAGLGFVLKRAQWQLVRRQGVERITWTYDPLQSRNANLNITKLGAVCNTYIPNYYGEMRDSLNIGMPSDRFQVDWWVNSTRVQKKLGKKPSKKMDLAHYLSADSPFANRTFLNDDGLIVPENVNIPTGAPIILLEIPADILMLKSLNPDLARVWSQHIRELFIDLFAQEYLVTDFVYLSGSQPRSFYVLSHGQATF